jgi:hypothetical protein
MLIDYFVHAAPETVAPDPEQPEPRSQRPYETLRSWQHLDRLNQRSGSTGGGVPGPPANNPEAQ